MKYEEIAGMSAKDLTKKKTELRQQMFEARMKNALGQLTNPMEIREMRRNIARLNTAMAAKVSVTASGMTPKKTGRKTAVKKTAKKSAGKAKG